MEEKILREVCETFGVSRRAIQGYEKAGLLSASGKNERGYLLYDKGCQERIRQILLYRKMGFKVKEIKELFNASKAELKKILERQAIKMAEGKVSVSQKTLYEFNGEYTSDTGDIFAKLENSSEEAVVVDSGTLVAFNENDEILLTQEYVNAPHGTTILERGEYIYVYEFLWDSL